MGARVSEWAPVTAKRARILPDSRSCMTVSREVMGSFAQNNKDATENDARRVSAVYKFKSKNANGPRPKRRKRTVRLISIRSLRYDIVLERSGKA